MARVCKKLFPKGFSHNRKDGFYMEGILKAQITNKKNLWKKSSF